jgi:hypothetical protein
MDEVRLYDLIDFILNSADEQELEVIRSAIRRRENDTSTDGPMGLNIGKMAKESATHISEQLGTSQTKIREIIQGFVKEQIKREAPEISEEQANELLDSWVPDSGKKKPVPEKAAKQLPSDAVIGMVKQFISFSTGAMTVTEEASLRQSIPDWQKRYWANFPPTIRKLVSLFLKGAMNGRDFWDGIYDELGVS